MKPPGASPTPEPHHSSASGYATGCGTGTITLSERCSAVSSVIVARGTMLTTPDGPFSSASTMASSASSGCSSCTSGS